MKDYRHKIVKLTNDQLKDNIINLNKDKLEAIKESSYLNGFNTILTLRSILQDDKKRSYLRNISEVNIFKRYINKAIGLINHSIDEKEGGNLLKEALDIRKDLYDLSKIIEGYFIELSHVGRIVDEHRIGINIKSQYKEKGLTPVNIEEIVKFIEKNLEESKNNYGRYNYIISEVVYSLPMRVTKEKYFNIIKRSLTRNLDNSNKYEVEDKINYYKRHWDSSLQYGYGVSFDYYFTRIEKLKKTKLKEKDLEELDEIVTELILLTKEINELYNFVLILGLTYNMIISIYLSEKIKPSMKVEEIWKEWKNVIEANDKDFINEFLEKNTRRIESNEKNIVAFLSEFEELNREALGREDFEEEELNDIFLYTKNILTYYNDYNLSDLDLLFSNNGKIASSFYLEQSINSLITYISRSMSKMSNIERKTRMRKILSLVELPFDNINQFKEYIRYSLDKRNNSQEKIKFTTDYIVYFLSNMKES